MPESPPRLAVWLVNRLVGGRDAEAVLGDLRETFEYRGGRLWFWGQALSCIAVRFSRHRRMLPAVGQDFHRALRRIRRNPGYALTAMFCLALAMGVNTVLFSFLDSLLYRELPVSEASRIVTVKRETSVFCAWTEYRALRGRLRSMDAAATLPASALLDIDRTSLRATMEVVSANYAGVLRLGTTLGTWFSNAQDDAREEPAVVISHRLWSTKLLADAAIIGKRVLIEEMPFRVVGIGPVGFAGATPPLATDLWVPAGALAASGDVRAARTRVNLIARLRSGAEPQTAAVELRVLNAELRAADPANPAFSETIHVEPAVGFLWTAGRRGLTPFIVFAALLCAVVLLIASVNVANLLLSRATVRRRDLALQRALGASRSRLFREVLVEGLVLALGGLAAGALAGYWLAGLLAAALPSIPIATGVAIRFDLDWRIAAALAVAGAFSAMLFSLPPALQSSRGELARQLKGGSSSRQREVYSLLQVSLSLSLLVAAVVTAQAMNRVQNADLGFATDHRLSAVLFAARSSPSGASRAAFSRALEAARRLPGVLDATLASGPLGPGPGTCAASSALVKARRTPGNVVDPSYFAAMQTPLLRGRVFSATETDSSEPVLVVSEKLATAWWPGAEALGKSVWLGCGPIGRRVARVIGVARDTRRSLNEEPQAGYYVSRLQDPGNGAFALLIRTAGPPARWARALQEAIHQTAPELRVFETQTLEDSLAAVNWAIRWQAALLAALSSLAMVLAVVGLYGVVAFSVAQRTSEIGVRMALGATRDDVEWMVLTHGLRIAVPGVLLGLVLSLALTPVLRRYLSGVTGLDAVSLAVASLAWVVVAMLASWYPARRATRVDPLAALRYE